MKSAIKTNNNRELMAAHKRHLAFSSCSTAAPLINMLGHVRSQCYMHVVWPGKCVYSFIIRRQLSPRNFVAP